MKSGSVARSAAVGVVTVAMLVAGCSSSKKQSSGSSTSPAAVAPSASGDSAGNGSSPLALPSVSGDPAAIKLYQQAITALSKVKSVHLKGEGSDGGDTFSIDLSFENGKGATGTIGLGGGTMKVIAVGDVTYVQADAAAFSSFAGADIPPAALQMIAGKWLKVDASAQASADNPFAGFGAAFGNLQNFAEQFTPSGSISLVPGTKTINGKTAVGILDAGDESGQSILYVEKDGDHLPLQVAPGPNASASPGSSDGPSTGTINFIDYNKPVTIAAPTDAIDISQLMALMGGPSDLPSAAASS